MYHRASLWALWYSTSIYVADLSWYEAINAKIYQYANDTTLYYHFKAADLSNCSKTISDSIEQLSFWSKDSNLAFDNDNTKVMILFSPQMYGVHHLSSIPLTNSSMVINLGASSYANCVHVNEHLKWDEHIKNTLAACYATVWVLKKAQTRGNISNKNNQLVEKLILSKLNYVELVYYPLPHFLLQRLQRVQFCGSEFCSWKVH